MRCNTTDRATVSADPTALGSAATATATAAALGSAATATATANATANARGFAAAITANATARLHRRDSSHDAGIARTWLRTVALRK